MFFNLATSLIKSILKGALFLCLFFNSSFEAISQVSVTLPVERSVFQRVNNVASVPIGGNVQNFANQIQARLIPINGGVAKDWTTIDSSPKGGAFSGELSYVQGGWYRLEVRSIENNIQVGEVSVVQKVGVGEVFLIAGQSNAQGGRPPTGGFFDKTFFGATDDRVNCINFYDNEEESLLPFPKISAINAETNIAPHGGASWCYGILGDKITKELNVPVLFFNAGVGGTRVKQWAQAARDEKVFDFYKNTFAPNGWPYAYLRKSINYYASLFGVRAILWHQGEEESLYGIAASDYKKDLASLISKSREHFGKNISWMVAKASRQAQGTSQNVKDGQQMVIDSSGFNVFQGPETDDIQPSSTLRDGGVHLHGTGLIELANAWASSIINERFLTASTPQLASPILKINTFNCVDKNRLTVSMPNNFTNPLWIWNKGQTLEHAFEKAINANTEYYGLVNDTKKNYLIAAPFIFSPKEVEIKLDQDPKICFGQSLKVSAISSNNNFAWSTGEKEKQIFLSKSGNYNLSLNSTDNYGCASTAETSFYLDILALPKSPVIEATTATTFCEGGKVNIIVKSDGLNNRIWNTGENAAFITLSKSTKVYLQNIDANNCKSNNSNTIEIIVNPLPETPKIQYTGKPQFCDGDSLKLSVGKNTGYFWEMENQKMNEKLGPEIYVNKSGKYKAAVSNSFGCISNYSEPLLIEALKLPDAPTISIIGKATLCAGDSTKINTKSLAKAYTWFSDGGNIEANTKADFDILSNIDRPSVEKTYRLKITDENGCASDFSNSVKIITKGNPLPPEIEKIGPYTLNTKTNDNKISQYIWMYNQTKLDDNLSNIKATKSGAYKVKVVSNYSINNESLNCTSVFSKSFQIDFANIDIVVYPNPVSSGTLYIETLDNLSNIELTFYSFYGQKVKSVFLNDTNNRQVVDVKNLKGHYFLEFKTGNKQVLKNIWIY
jgi:Carbohydrate esterase, sialic acid-specific acetylesterase/Secretion system C-terminal sorting domain